MRVFISHKNVDSYQALILKNAFQLNGIDVYLDVLDSSINSGGKALTDHIKAQLNKCTDIIVLMSASTQNSWWVPFEIGMAAQADMYMASFLKEDVALPSYLSYWPRLKTTADVNKYVDVRRRVASQFRRDGRFALSSGKEEIRIFHETLKRELG